MPRTRAERAREEKVEEIVTLAEAQLREGGWEALSVAEIARRLGVAQAAVYWYFPSRDHLFVAALRRMVAGLLVSKPPHRAGLERQVLWWVDRLDELTALRAAVHQRARTSEVVAEFERESYEGLEAMLRGALTGTVPPARAAAVATTLIAAVDGILLRAPSRRRRDAMVRSALRLLL